MNNEIRLDYEKAKAQAAVVRTDAEVIETILNDLVSQVDANVNNSSVWTGEAAQDFKETWDKYADNFNAFISHVKSIQEKIDYTATQVSSFDTSASNN